MKSDKLDSTSYAEGIRPRIIIHGGAGAITPANLPPALYEAHRAALLSILSSTNTLLSQSTTTALDAAVHAVTLLEANPLYNAGHGSVFTTAGRIEHEASIMLSTPHPGSEKGARHFRKRYAACTGTSRVRHPILLVKEVLVRGEAKDGGGAGGHNMISGSQAEALAKSWNLEVDRPSSAWTKLRWDQHRRGLGLGTTRNEYEQEKVKADAEAGYPDEIAQVVTTEHEVSTVLTEDCGIAVASKDDWNGLDYVPQGTVGAVVLDSYGTIAVATSTGGMTNKLPGRIGDTPQAGAGFWAEQFDHTAQPSRLTDPQPQPQDYDLSRMLQTCFGLPTWLTSSSDNHTLHSLPAAFLAKPTIDPLLSQVHAVGMSGTGNGDSFLRLDSVRTVAAQVRFSNPRPSLQTALQDMAGPGGELQRSAEERWGVTGEGEGGIIGIELVGGEGKVVSDFNCGGMFRAWIDDEGESRMMVFRDEYAVM